MPAVTSDTETMSPPADTPLAAPERDDDSIDSPAHSKFKTRRSVACKSCHNLKVKCTPADESNPGGPCIRCMNAKRKCEIDLHQPRKRRRKAEVLAAAANGNGIKLDDDVAGFENGNSFAGAGATGGSNGGSTSGADASTSAVSVANSVAESTVTEYKSDKDHIRALQDRVQLLEAQLQDKKGVNSNSPPFVSKRDIEKELMALSDINLVDITKFLRFFADQRAALTRNSVVDVVTMGVISMEEAQIRFGIYKQIFNNYAMVDIPEDLDCEGVRTRYPIFFNALMSVSNALYKSDSNDLVPSLRLDNEAVKSIALEAVVVGTKSQEIVKSLLLLCLWYNSAELFRQRRYHLLNGLCVTLFHDLGATGKPQYSFKNDLATMAMSFAQDASVEYRSLILILYFTTVSICLILRRSIYVKWTAYVEDCCASLENSGNIRWIRTALIARLCRELDRIHHSIHQCDSASTSSSTIKYLIIEFENNLAAIKRKIGPKDHILLSYYYSIEAYLHEPKLKEIFTTDTDSESVRLDEYKMRQVSNCTKSCLKAINEYISLGHDQVAMAPLFASCRIIYTAGMLLRLRFLILSLPSLIDKSLVPIQAIQSVLQLLHLLDETAKVHPNNHFLNKTRLVLRLFIQTYVTQVRGLLKKNGETPQNFKTQVEISEPGSITQQLGALETQMMPPMEDLPNSNVPLDLLSYAASFRRDDKGEVNSPLPVQDIKNLPRHTPLAHTPLSSVTSTAPPPPPPKLNGADEQPKGPRGLILVLHLDLGKLQPTLNQTQSGLMHHRPSLVPRTLISPLPPIRIPTPKDVIPSMGQSLQGSEVNGNNSFVPGVSASPVPGPRYPDLQPIATSLFSGGATPATGGVLEPTAKTNFFDFDLNADPLDPTLSINEEFWGDLLSSNDANTLNFSRSNNDYQNQVELFFG